MRCSPRADGELRLREDGNATPCQYWACALVARWQHRRAEYGYVWVSPTFRVHAMPRSIPSNATKEMLRWGRETAGLTIEDVARAERLPPESLAAWERGEGTPSFAMLKRLAKRYKRPVMVFYLPEPPRDFSVVKDFRLLPANVSREFSPELRYAVRLAQERQAWASEQLEDEGVGKNPLVRTLTDSANFREEATRFRGRLGVSIRDQATCGNDFDAFRLWRERCEAEGVFVFQTSRVAVEEMRGCALVDQYAPVVMVNSRDAPTARIFTLIHEVAHILLGESAVTGGGTYVFSRSPTHNIEKLCNHFAAEVLVPANDFRSRVPPNWKTRDDEVIKRAASVYHVSRAVIGLRLVETGLASEAYLRSKWPSLQAKPTQRKDTSGGPPQHVLALSRTGSAFARLALSAFHSGEIHGGELASLLGMKLKHLGQLESVLYPNRAQSLLGA